MRTFILLVIAVTMACSGLRGDPPAKKETSVLRPVLWWSDLGRVSDGGGPSIKASTELVTDAKTFARLWTKHRVKGDAPKINFNEYFAVVTFRESGVDFQQGGLAVDGKGAATVSGLPAHWIVTNAGWYSGTIGVFPRKGVVSVDGTKLPSIE